MLARECRARISLRYPIVELLTGAVFVVLYLHLGLDIEFVKYVVLFSVMVVIAFTDLEHGIIPDKIVIFTVLAGMFFQIIMGINIRSVMLGAFIPAGILYLMAIFANGGVGGGDIKLVFATGFFLGWPGNATALMASCLSAGFVSLILIATHRKKKTDTIIFGPFLAFGTIAVALSQIVITNL